MYLQLNNCYRIKYKLLRYHTLGFCRDAALCRSLQANTLYP